MWLHRHISGSDSRKMEDRSAVLNASVGDEKVTSMENVMVR
jgi:hypothetical protein